jgi:hypothetical protein
MALEADQAKLCCSHSHDGKKKIRDFKLQWSVLWRRGFLEKFAVLSAKIIAFYISDGSSHFGF